MRKVFALDYIGETVQCYAIIASSEHYEGDDSEKQWAHDVLTRYFEVTEAEEVISRAKEVFDAIPNRVNGDRIPYRRDLSEKTVSFDSFKALSKRRRSVRWFEDKPVPRELLFQAMDAAREAPSACNRQPFVFRAFDEPQMVRKVASVPYGTVGYSDNIPTIVVVVGQMRNYFDERDRHLIYIDGALAGMSFVLALETLGLSSCMINWPDIDANEVQMRRLLGLESDERPVFMIAAGFPDPDGLVANSTKKSVNELLIFPSDDR
ncbi:nitroreductase family protein [Verrucomicrobiales bacterium]|nr:nitroreductase family protein [Verrucomicrobiales bacterium]